MSEILQAILFGTAGAFIPANSELITCLGAARENGRLDPYCLLKFAFSLAVGAIGAAAFGPWVADYLHMSTTRDLNGIATLIGLTANGTAPVLVKFAPRLASSILTSMRGRLDDEP